MFKKFFQKENKKFKKIAEKELQENFSAIKSLKEYDQGKKDISTSKIESRMRDLQASSQ